MSDRRDVEVDHNPLVVTAHHHEIKRLAGVKVQLLMRYVRGEVDEITGRHFRCKFELFAPAYLAPTFHDVDRNLVAAMVMRPRLCTRLESHRADPSTFSPTAGEIKCGRTSCSRRFKRG